MIRWAIFVWKDDGWAIHRKFAGKPKREYMLATVDWWGRQFPDDVFALGMTTARGGEFDIPEDEAVGSSS